MSWENFTVIELKSVLYAEKFTQDLPVSYNALKIARVQERGKCTKEKLNAAIEMEAQALVVMCTTSGLQVLVQQALWSPLKKAINYITGKWGHLFKFFKFLLVGGLAGPRRERTGGPAHGGGATAMARGRTTAVAVPVAWRRGRHRHGCTTAVGWVAQTMVVVTLPPPWRYNRPPHSARLPPCPPSSCSGGLGPHLLKNTRHKTFSRWKRNKTRMQSKSSLTISSRSSMLMYLSCHFTWPQHYRQHMKKSPNEWSSVIQVSLLCSDLLFDFVTPPSCSDSPPALP